MASGPTHPLQKRTPTNRELAADGAVHVVGLCLGLPAAIAVVAAAARAPGQLEPVALYAAGLAAMFGCSAAYHLFRASRRRDWLQRLAIFAMIAGTYTPFTLRLERAWALGLTAAIWLVAALGMILKLWRPRRVSKMMRGSISVALYLALGWIGLLALGPFMASLAPSTLLLLAAGGVIYSAGVVFHLWERLPYQNAIWHGCVLVAAAVHYLAVLRTLIA